MGVFVGIKVSAKEKSLKNELVMDKKMCYDKTIEKNIIN